MVYVCKQGTDNCQKCGAAQSVKAGKWAVSHCPTGIKGDSVKITQAGAQNLQLCEVEVHGTGSFRHYCENTQVLIKNSRHRNRKLFCIFSSRISLLMQGFNRE